MLGEGDVPTVIELLLPWLGDLRRLGLLIPYNLLLHLGLLTFWQLFLELLLSDGEEIFLLLNFYEQDFLELFLDEDWLVPPLDFERFFSHLFFGQCLTLEFGLSDNLRCPPLLCILPFSIRTWSLYEHFLHSFLTDPLDLRRVLVTLFLKLVRRTPLLDFILEFICD